MDKEAKITLGSIVKELSDEGGVRSERQYRRDLERFFELCGSDIKRFKEGRQFLFTKNEAIIYKELLRLMDCEGYLCKYLSGQEDKVTDCDIIMFYECLESALNKKVENLELNNNVVEQFLDVIDMSMNYNFTKYVYELEEKFTALLKITNIYPHKKQNDMIKYMIEKIDPFFDRVYVQAMKDIINFTGEKIKQDNKEKNRELTEQNRTYSYQELQLIDREKRVSEFFEAYPDEKKKIEEHLGVCGIEKYFTPSTKK